MFNDMLLELIVTPVIGMLAIGMLFTVIAQVAFLPFDVVTVIVAVPGPTAVTNPLEDTFATYSLLEFHITATLSVVSLGMTVAVNC